MNNSITEVTRARALSQIPKRNPFSHKGDYGRALLLCGSRRYSGAPFFAAQAAVNTGSGLVFLALPKSIYPILAQKLNEPIINPLPEDENGVLSVDAAIDVEKLIQKCDVCLAGPGLGRGAGIDKILEILLAQSSKPIVLDADGLNAAADKLYLLKKAKIPVVLTPHEGEFARLYPGFDSEKRLEAALDFAVEYNCILVLKGHRTITALPDGEAFINTSGNPGMAKGGSGDILAGIITSLIGQGIEPKKAAYIGVWLHGASGDYCRDTFGEYGMTPTDMLYGIKAVMKGCDESEWHGG